jgi:hypothetical protein
VLLLLLLLAELVGVEGLVVGGVAELQAAACSSSSDSMAASPAHLQQQQQRMSWSVHCLHM